MKFAELSKYLQELENTSSRNEMTVLLSDLFKKSSTSEIDKTVYLLLGGVAPRYKEVVFNIADKMMLKAIAKAFSKDLELVNKQYKKAGDIGDVVYGLADGQITSQKALTIDQVHEKLTAIADSEGLGSQERKQVLMAELLSGVDRLSGKYVARITLGKLRLGFSDKTMIDALSWMVGGDKSAKSVLEGYYQVLPDIGLLASNVKRLGLKKAVYDAHPVVGVPVFPMLAQRLKDPDEMVKKMGRVAVEPKLDGLRISIHFKRGKTDFVKAYTRNMNEVSWMFPELLDIGKYVDAKELILDSEAIGLSGESKKLANFQSTMTRRRKHDVEAYIKNIPIKFYIFDILFKNGKNYMNEDYLTRKKELEKTVSKSKIIELVDYVVTETASDISLQNATRRQEGYEGIMLKKVDSKYVPGRTGWRWVKMKEGMDSAAKLSDTIDCVVMGYTAGHGKRVGFGIGQFLAGVRSGEKIVTVTKVGTGLTDEQFKQLNRKLIDITVSDKPEMYDVQKDYNPDFWVKPEVIVEIAGDDITKSPKHTGGLAVRFPRLIKFRDDRSIEDITTIAEVNDLLKLQK